jgi:hypothetical protein
VELIGKDVELKSKDVELIGKDVELKSKDVELIGKDVELKSKDVELKEKDLCILGNVTILNNVLRDNSLLTPRGVIGISIFIHFLFPFYCLLPKSMWSCTK